MSKITQVTVFDEDTGEVLTDKMIFGQRMKGGWVMLYQQKGLDLIAKAPNASVLKVFMYLACGQTYEGGMKTSKAAIGLALGMSKPTIINACNWLKDNYIIHEWRRDGVADFMVNPLYVSLGKFDERMKLWNDRWADYKPMIGTKYLRRKQRAERSGDSNAAT